MFNANDSSMRGTCNTYICTVFSTKDGALTQCNAIQI